MPRRVSRHQKLVVILEVLILGAGCLIVGYWRQLSTRGSLSLKIDDSDSSTLPRTPSEAAKAFSTCKWDDDTGVVLYRLQNGRITTTHGEIVSGCRLLCPRSTDPCCLRLVLLSLVSVLCT